MARGDFEESKRLAEKIDNAAARQAYLQAVARAEFRVHLAKGELTRALAAARAMQEPNARALLYAQLMRAAARKGDEDFSKLVLAEARAGLTNSAPDGLRARALLLLAAETAALPSPREAVEVLQSAVAAINSPPQPSPDAAAPPALTLLAEISDPRSLLAGGELARAFAAVARVDFDSAALAARSINERAASLGARLAVTEVRLAAAPGASKPAAVRK